MIKNDGGPAFPVTRMERNYDAMPGSPMPSHSNAPACRSVTGSRGRRCRACWLAIQRRTAA